MDKIILINKPKGCTSFDVVRQCKRIFHEKKIGHSGTLDPEASGLLLVVMGKYTKYLPFCVKDHKQYLATFKTGIMTDTLDIFGTILEEREAHIFTEDELNEACIRFSGEIEQVPPMYSAIKVNGKKLYEYAREGKEIDRKARKVYVNDLKITSLGNHEYKMKATVSSGTYIRSLIADICDSLNELGVMTSLERIAIEHLSLAQAIPLEEVNENTIGLSAKDIITKEYAFVEYNDVKRIKNGMPIELEGYGDKVMLMHKDEIIAAYHRKEKNIYTCIRGLW
ncbi:MAG: tRNA pseudouridine(55) synthase TruB [Solobacterium sp.]|nr:tRNA pseudouridine(55) synthase TruB [Solobacterium sp.]